MILAPMLTFCLVFMPFVLKILYSDRFLAANEFISWACLGMILRFGSWVISFLFIAKAESKLFIKVELAANLYYLIFSIFGYKILGLTGLGIAFAMEYVVYFIQCYIIVRKRYDFRFSNSFIKCYAIQLLLVISCLVIVLVFNDWLKYVLGGIIIAISSILGLKGLNEKMDLLSIIKQRIKK